MKRGIILLASLFLMIESGMASVKDDNRLKAAEQALSKGRYAEAKATFEDLKDNPQYRQKCYLYLATIYHETGQVENALAALADFRRYITDNTDVSLLKSSENLEEEIAKHYATLDIAIIEPEGQTGVDPGFYNLAFSSEEGLNPPQEARLKFINKILSQSQGLFKWKSDGTLLMGSITNFPVRMYDTSPMTAEVNGIPIYFRFDFQTRQGLWIPYESLSSRAPLAPSAVYRESTEPYVMPEKTSNQRPPSKLLLVGAAAALAVAIGLAVSQ